MKSGSGEMSNFWVERKVPERVKVIFYTRRKSSEQEGETPTEAETQKARG